MVDCLRYMPLPYHSRLGLQLTALLCPVQKPNTPRATQAPPGGADEAPRGMWRMMPAGIVSGRFQQLFRGKGNLLTPYPGPHIAWVSPASSLRDDCAFIVGTLWQLTP